jgi:hypothetical protein
MTQKMRPDTFTIGNSFDGFSDDQWEALGKAYGDKLDNELRGELVKALSDWLFHFEFADGPDRQDLANSFKIIKNGADKVWKEINKVYEVDDFYVDLLLPKETKLSDLKPLFEKLSQPNNIVEDLFSNTYKPIHQAVLVQTILDTFEEYGYSTAISKNKSQDETFRASPCVRFLAELRDQQPRLRIHRSTEKYSERLVSFSDWVYRRNQEDISV